MTKPLTIAILILLTVTPITYAQTNKDAFRSTNYPLPRFVSLRSNEVYARTGPGKQYPIRHIYKRKNLPVEITLEYEGWRKIKDFDGDEGWVHNSLLTGKRTGLIKGTENVPLMNKPKSAARKKAYLEPGTINLIEECENNWCKINSAGYEGWVKQDYLWGVYDNENFD